MKIPLKSPIFISNNLAIGLAVFSTFSAVNPASAYQFFINNRTDFNNSLNTNSLSTIVDNGHDFGAAPSAATNLDRVTRSGNINGANFSYNIYDVNFSETPNGQINPGVAGGDIFSLSKLAVEAPVKQDGAIGTAAWGVDSVGTDSTIKRNAAVFNFTVTPESKGIGHFGLDLLDLESDANFRLAEIRLYKGGSQVYFNTINWGTDNGSGKSHFLGLIADNNDQFFDQISIVVGDDNSGAGGFGFTEAWAAENFTFGQAYASTVIPNKGNTPTTLEPSNLLGIFSLLAFGFWKRNFSTDVS
jgi:hypothetical protein